jgi:hypothetical protein
MTESLTPEDRLRRYKEFISGLADANDSRRRSRSPALDNTTSDAKKAPVKKELIAALAVLKEANEKDSPPAEQQSARKNVMLKIKEKALESSMLEIRDEKRRLERKLEKGEITKAEYEAEIQKLVRKGKRVLKGQSIVAARKNGVA